LISATVFGVAFTAGMALAECPKRPPSHKWNIQSGDQRVDAAFLSANLSGKRVRYRGDGTERYHKDGSYSYQSEGLVWPAPSYKFYSNGVRCIDYPTPRFDLYVVNNKKLVLVNMQDWRGIGRVLR
jgi:hypothetical protein